MHFHCASHELNLRLSKASKVPEVHSMVKTMQSLCLFFRFSVKRQIILEAAIAQTYSNNEKTKQKVKQKVKPLCETIWVERETAFDNLISLYEEVTFCLDKIEQNDDPDNRFHHKSLTEAAGINKRLKSSAFQVALDVCHYIYGYTNGLSKKLQGSTIEIIRAYKLISLITNQLQEIRDNAEVEFKAIIEKCIKMAELSRNKLGVPKITTQIYHQM